MGFILILLTAALFAQDSTEVLAPSNAGRKLSPPHDGGKFHFWAADSNGAYSPKRAMIFSIMTPGLGQMYVRKPVKGLIYFAAEVYCVQQVLAFQKEYDDIVRPNINRLKEKIGDEKWFAMEPEARTAMLRDSTDYNLKRNYWRPEEQRNKRIWWCAGVYIMAMLDCYVDAHLSDFPKGDLEFINDSQIKSNGIRFSIPIQGLKK
ncbi:MAG: hypothetical protein JXQ65_16285 [Candidatus Marinimicrobia bacterium]|nr:hypothetical protein [Candidatus Neomarinimicrobiota bacterium]